MSSRSSQRSPLASHFIEGKGSGCELSGRSPDCQSLSAELQLGGAMAADEMAGGGLLPFRAVRPAPFDCVGTAPVKMAARGGIGGFGYLPLQDDTLRT
jgi:hypothetical protein